MNNEPILKANKWNTLTGQQLHDMGRFYTSDNLLISVKFNYSVWLVAGKWIINPTGISVKKKALGSKKLK